MTTNKSFHKIILSSTYGIIPPSNEFIFYDPKIAEEITKSGREILQQLIESTKNLDYEIK